MESDRGTPAARRILCIGMPVRDMIFRVHDVPPRGGKFQADRLEQVSGGNATNAAVTIARLGGRVRLAGPIGEAKAETHHILDLLSAEGIETDQLVRVPGAATPLSSIMIDATGERTVVIYRDPRLWHVTMPDHDRLLDGVDAVLTESRCADFVTDICADALVRGIPVVLDADRAIPLCAGLLTASSHVIFSAEALRGTAETDDPVEALARVATITPAFLAVTNGPQGVHWRGDGGIPEHMPSFPVEAVDTLAAGDAFHGAFALAIAEGQPLEAALRFSSAAAALKCTRFGGAYGSPLRPEVEALLGH